ncbi:MAG: PIG-L deacetylase family protein [Euryarchaeota archaeon]|nr:PIG-L deacetylase family protein [Euryarchaeota archaeon]
MVEFKSIISLINLFSILLLIIYLGSKIQPLKKTSHRNKNIEWILIVILIFLLPHNFYYLINTNSNIWFWIICCFLNNIGLCIIIKIVLQSKVKTKSDPKPMNILVIGAHPDDMEIACGGTIARFCDAGHTVWCLILSQGERGGVSSHRVEEAKKSAKFLGLNRIEIRNFPDTKLDNFISEIANNIEEIVKEFKPDIVFTHSNHDLHQDHRAVHQSTLRACNNQNSILCYESPSTTQDFHPNLFIDIEDFLEIKIESILLHKDQKTKRYVQPESIYRTALFRGNQAKSKLVEGFEVIRINIEGKGIFKLDKKSD